ncbi:MAG: hypothetical protein GF317_07075 [Candidatus Lokiarchaeota archaeon]|nr:hypothetical protein [Candidatus Lokiarchaeota archaeon]MBD3199470.1 hypothetical protein [Candidatus Lokiarchaeota archaeon]
MTKLISKVVEVDSDKESLLKAIYKAKTWETISPVKKITVEFLAPNVFRSDIIDEVDIVKIPIEMSGEMVMEDKGEIPDKGRLIELNVRNNKDVRELEARLRIKAISPTKSKVGVFVHNFKLASDFLNMIGDASELILRTKISEILRNLETHCRTKGINDLLQ